MDIYIYRERERERYIYTIMILARIGIMVHGFLALVAVQDQEKKDHVQAYFIGKLEDKSTCRVAKGDMM